MKILPLRLFKQKGIRLSMLQILKQPAPHLYDWKSIFIRYISVGLFIAFFLIVFQPFGTASARIPNKTLFLSGYGWITFLVFSLFHLGALRLFPKVFLEEQWFLWKEIVFLLIGLSLTFLACYIYMNWCLGFLFNFQSFFGFYFVVLSISIFPTTIITLLSYIYELQKHQTVAKTYNEQLLTKTPSLTNISFKDENDKVDFSLPQDQLLFIKAANNYVEINYLAEEQIKKYLLRNSLGAVEQQLDISAIRRCHRSYLVNLEKVGRITGNAQGYKLHFPFTSEYVVPVSRSKGKELLALLKK